MTIDMQKLKQILGPNNYDIAENLQPSFSQKTNIHPFLCSWSRTSILILDQYNRNEMKKDTHSIHDTTKWVQ